MIILLLNKMKGFFFTKVPIPLVAFCDLALIKCPIRFPTDPATLLSITPHVSTRRRPTLKTAYWINITKVYDTTIAHYLCSSEIKLTAPVRMSSGLLDIVVYNDS